MIKTENSRIANIALLKPSYTPHAYSNEGRKLPTKAFGFTLAEVLITLGIIGGIAAMTLPNLVTNIKVHQTETSLKRSYSLFNQALKLSVADNGDIQNWDFPKENTEDENLEFTKIYIFPYLKVTNSCGGGLGCWAKTEYKMDGDEITVLTGDQNIIKFQTVDGINMALFCSDVCHIYFDTNGNSRPNTRGKDIFEFVLSRVPNDKNSNFYPMGYTDNVGNMYRCQHTGNTCAAIIMENNWKIPKDYPW